MYLGKTKLYFSFSQRQHNGFQCVQSIDMALLAPRDRWVVETDIFVTILSQNAKKHVSECPQNLNSIFLDNISIFKKFTKFFRFSGFFELGEV